MTESEALKEPIDMPENYIPYLDQHRIYRFFKDMLQDLIVHLPKDHLKHMKGFVRRRLLCVAEPESILLLVSPELDIKVKKIAKELVKNLGVFVITRRCIMDRYENHDDYKPGCVSPTLLTEVTKALTYRDPVLQAGWLMFDHPCTVLEAKSLQANGVLPSITVALMPQPQLSPSVINNHTSPRGFFDQDFEVLKYAYRATLKEVYVESSEYSEVIASKCFNAIQAYKAGAQGPRQGFNVVGAPSVYRVLLIGPRGSGRSTQALNAAKHFGLVYLNFDHLFREALARDDELSERIRKYGTSSDVNAEIVKRRLLSKDCIDHGWVMVKYPISSREFERLDLMKTPPNRVIFLQVDIATCKTRMLQRGVDWCTGKQTPVGSGPTVQRLPFDKEDQMDADLDFYFSEALAELRAAAGINAVTLNANLPVENLFVKIQAAIMASPAFDVNYSSQLRNVRAD